MGGLEPKLYPSPDAPDEQAATSIQAMLASASPILKDAFLCGGRTELPFGDVAADAMQLLLEWIYGKVKASLTLSQAASLFQLAHKFDILELQLQCEQTLKASVAMETYHQLQDLATRFDCTPLMQVCNRFQERLDEGGLKQLEEHLASYTAAQVVHPPLYGAQMPAYAEMPSCPAQSERVDQIGCLGGIHGADAASQTCPGGIPCADAATHTTGARGLLDGNVESAHETMLTDSQPTAVDGRPALVIAHGADTSNSPVPQKAAEFLASESPQSVLETREYQGTTSSDGCNSGDTGTFCILRLLRPYSLADDTEGAETSGTLLKDVMEAPGSSATELPPSTNSPQDEAQALHEQPTEDAPVLQGDILPRAQVAGSPSDRPITIPGVTPDSDTHDIMEVLGGSATELPPSTNSPQDEAQVLHEQPSEDATVLQGDSLPKARVAVSPSDRPINTPGVTLDSGGRISMSHQAPSTEDAPEAARAADAASSKNPSPKASLLFLVVIRCLITSWLSAANSHALMALGL
ncbi:hypothetical protein WJX82_001613 [Trebouxia sp. C0006]